MTTRKDFEKAAKRRFLKGEVEPLGEVQIRSLTAREYYNLGQVIEDLGSRGGGELNGISQTAVLIIFTVCGKDGKTIFETKEPGEVKEGELLVNEEDIDLIVGLPTSSIEKFSRLIKTHLEIGGAKKKEGEDSSGK